MNGLSIICYSISEKNGLPPNTKLIYWHIGVRQNGHHFSADIFKWIIWNGLVLNMWKAIIWANHGKILFRHICFTKLQWVKYIRRSTWHSQSKIIWYAIWYQQCEFETRGPYYQHGLTLIQAWICNHIYYEVWDEITYPILNFNGATVEV